MHAKAKQAHLCCFLILLLPLIPLLLRVRELHDVAIRRVVRAPVSFFDANPIGRVLNIFSKDVGYTDDTLPYIFYDFLQCVTWCAATLVLSVIVNPLVLFAVAPLGLVFVRLKAHALHSTREVTAALPLRHPMLLCPTLLCPVLHRPVLRRPMLRRPAMHVTPFLSRPLGGSLS